MASEMIIRELEKADLTRLLTLYTQLHSNPMPEQDQGLLMLWNEILADRNHHILGAFVGEGLVSACVVIIVPNLTHGQRPYALIENVITAEAHRKQGYASAVLAAAKKMAEENRCYKIMLLTGSKQESILRLYERAGYNRNDKTGFILWL